MPILWWNKSPTKCYEISSQSAIIIYFVCAASLFSFCIFFSSFPPHKFFVFRVDSEKKSSEPTHFCCCLLLFKVSIWAIRMMKQLKVKCDYELNRPFPPKQKKKVYGDNYTNMLTCTLNKCSVQTFHWNGSEWCANSQAKELNCKKFKLKLIECESS